MTTRECRFCGRRWYYHGQKGGFIKSASQRHINACEARTPAERRAINERDEEFWRNNPPRSVIKNNPDHPGVKDANPEDLLS